MSRKVFSVSESVCWQIGRRNRGGCGGRIAKSDHRKADPSLKKRSVFYKKTTEHHRKVKGGLLFAVTLYLFSWVLFVLVQAQMLWLIVRMGLFCYLNRERNRNENYSNAVQCALGDSE